jgi:hypothetical protein
MFDLQAAFFRPLWIRIATVAVCLGWAGVELAGGSAGFAMIFAAAGFYAAWQFFIAWAPQDDDERKDDG